MGHYHQIWLGTIQKGKRIVRYKRTRTEKENEKRIRQVGTREEKNARRRKTRNGTIQLDVN